MSNYADALEAAYLIDRLERLARSGEAEAGLNPAQWEALRFLARANRFSRNPAALATYLGSTRGTVSQTLIALQAKGFITREPNARDKRSLDLTLTKQAEEILTKDPLLAMAQDIAEATGSASAALVSSLQAMLMLAIQRNGGRAFGACHTCRHFQKHHVVSATTPHHCGLLNEPLSAADAHCICVEQELAPRS
jgi:DNA-binding MarR family transcriptional regulator